MFSRIRCTCAATDGMLTDVSARHAGPLHLHLGPSQRDDAPEASSHLGPVQEHESPVQETHFGPLQKHESPLQDVHSGPVQEHESPVQEAHFGPLQKHESPLQEVHAGPVQKHESPVQDVHSGLLQKQLSWLQVSAMAFGVTRSPTNVSIAARPNATDAASTRRIAFLIIRFDPCHRLRPAEGRIRPT